MHTATPKTLRWRSNLGRRLPPATWSPRGFTLVEMLVAVTLVLLIMSMFAQIFQIAGSTITTQRGIAENDQRSRSLQNILKADLDKRTFRLVMPWTVGENGSLPDTLAVERQGYFYISENDPDDDTDDLIQFTMNINIQTKNPDLTVLYGKATAIPGATNLIQNPNQPEVDDGWPEANGAGQSPAAEVAYFLRGGKLYRRVLLLRQPLPLDLSISQPGFQDNSVSPAVFRDYFDPNLSFYASGNQQFWNDFDYSAFFDVSLAAADRHARFHSVDDLSNSSTQTQFPLGKPRWRFGHRLDTWRSSEFDADETYYGRFTQEETSHVNFRFPQALANITGNPIPTHTDTVPAMDVAPNYDFVFDSFQGGPRRGEDLILNNVQGFDVKVWDPTAQSGAGSFVDIGSTDPANPAAAFSMTSSTRLNNAYGPSTTAADNRVFDTWYPFPVVDGVIVTTPELDLHPLGSTDGQNDQPPFVNRTFTPGGGSGQQPFWTARAYSVGDLVFPTSANQRANGLRFYYRCVVAGGSGTSVEPTATEWPAAPGVRFEKASGEPTWEAVDNWRPLQAIQLTVRYLDVTSNQIRQSTIVHSFVD